MLGLQAEAGGSLYKNPDPLCMNNASLHALQRLQPWAEEKGNVEDRPAYLSASSLHSPAAVL